MRIRFGWVMVALTALLSGCGYNAMQIQDEQIKAARANFVLS